MGLLTKQIKRVSKKEFAFAMLFLIMLAFNIWMAPRSSSFLALDEAFYIAVPYRMLQGDALLIHEWNMAQMGMFLLKPLLRVYLALMGTTEGILLNFRYIYVFFHSLVALYVYFRLRKINFMAAAAVALFYMAYCYGNIMALSYNTIGIGLMLMTCVSLAVCKGKAAEMFAIGLLFAGAVLCCPFLLIAYVIYCLAVLYFRIMHRLPKHVEGAFAVKSWLCFSAGCAALAVVFVLPVLLSGESAKIIKTLPLILQDEEHPSKTLVEWAKGFCVAFIRSNAWFKELAIAGTILFCVILLDKNKTKRRSIYLIAASIISMVFALPYILMYREGNYLLFPISIIGFYAYLLCTKKNVPLFVLVYVPGIIFWACRDMGSNLGFYSISAGAAVNMAASLVFVAELAEEIWGKKGRFAAAEKVLLLIPSLCLVCLFSTMIVSRVEVIDEIDAVCSVGSAKGIAAGAEQISAIEREYESLAPIRDIKHGNVMYFSLSYSCLHYLEDEKNCSSYSMWFIASEKNMEKLDKYWSMFPEKKPDYICLTDEQFKDEALVRNFDKYSYSVMSLSDGAVLCMDYTE